MMIVMVAITIFSLIIIFCVRHFFVQLIAIKLLIDSLALIAAAVRGGLQTSYNGEATSVLIGSLGLLIFFVLLASGIQQFSKTKLSESGEES